MEKYSNDNVKIPDDVKSMSKEELEQGIKELEEKSSDSDKNDTTNVSIPETDENNDNDDNISESDKKDETDTQKTNEPDKIVDEKLEPLTKIEGVAMFLCFIVIMFACNLCLYLRLSSQIDGVSDVVKINNYRISQSQVDLDDIKAYTKSIAKQNEIDKTPFLGVGFNQKSDSVLALKIDKIYDSSPAQFAGLKEGDIILAVDDEKVDSREKLSNIIAAHKAKDTIKITVATVEDGKIANKTVEAQLTYRGNFDLG